jgi:hypothetical protein
VGTPGNSAAGNYSTIFNGYSLYWAKSLGARRISGLQFDPKLSNH